MGLLAREADNCILIKGHKMMSQLSPKLRPLYLEAKHSFLGQLPHRLTHIPNKTKIILLYCTALNKRKRQLNFMMLSTDLTNVVCDSVTIITDYPNQLIKELTLVMKPDKATTTCNYTFHPFPLSCIYMYLIFRV